jgi:hypothetical protein
MPTEADTCRRFVVPKLQAAGWDNEPCSIAEQRTITDGRIVPVGKGFVRRPLKRVDYLLRYRRDFPLAVVEAKPEYKTAADGLQQAKQYAEMLGLKFAYASNGPDTIEFDYFTGLEKTGKTTEGRHRGRVYRLLVEALNVWLVDVSEVQPLVPGGYIIIPSASGFVDEATFLLGGILFRQTSANHVLIACEE